jgi:N-carbamoyl-L-amino-acid hydrolase
MALGLIEVSELDTAIRTDTGQTLGHHIAACGFDPDRVKNGPAYLDPRRIQSYFELHIEQGPVLELKNLAVGIVSSIRGNSRLRKARCLGAYNHGGATPQEVRRDAVIATSELILSVDRKWGELHAAGEDLIFTFGKVHTDPAVHSLSKVPGEMHFSLDMRSGSPQVLASMRAFVSEEAQKIGAKRSVRFELGDFSISEPTVLDKTLCRALHTGCDQLEMPAFQMASGGGHDAQEFTRAGVSSAMIFVRNANGSHVSDEAMEMSDFEAGTRLLAWAVATTSPSQ